MATKSSFRWKAPSKPVPKSTPKRAPQKTAFIHQDHSCTEMKASRIDFTQTPLPEYDGLYAVLISNVLTRQECAALLARAEAQAGATGWERAMVNIGNGRQAMYTDTRNCGRIIWDSQEEMDAVFARIKDLPEVQEIHRLEGQHRVTGWAASRKGEKWVFTRPNERMRFLKYVGGEYFRPHIDGCYDTPDGKERSWFTMHLYLNDGETVDRSGEAATEDEKGGETGPDVRNPDDELLVGGATTFHGDCDDGQQFDVNPRAGAVLIFQHRNLVHSGDDVVRGTKYTLRTDLMYTREELEK